MIVRLIEWSIDNRLRVLLLALLVAGAGVYALRHTALDAIPDLSDVQVIVRTGYPGQAPQIVEDQVTYPLASALRAVPGAVTVRGYSYFGDSFVYVIFADGTDPYWARSRVLEYLSQAASRLPPGARPELGPDATGVGWVFQYALLDRSGRHDLAQLRSLQDWFLKYELQTVPGVAEVASVGGMVKQYQVVLDPVVMRNYSLSLGKIKQSLQEASREVGGAAIEMAEAEYRVHSRGTLTGLDELRRVFYLDRNLPLRRSPAALAELAEIRAGPQARQGIAELDGEGEVVGGIVVMRYGHNALTTIEGVKERLAALRPALPPGVEVVEVYDRSGLILRAVGTLSERLIEEFIVVVLVCAAFLLHLRSALVVVLSLPLGILAAFAVMHAQGINANLMSLGGIAIAIGAMVDATIVMIENAHKRLEASAATSAPARLRAIREAAVEVGPPLFFSLIIITLSFLPVLSLQAQEGRLFGPLAYTKTYAMAAAAALSVTLVPALMAWLIRGRIRAEHESPVNRLLTRLYTPAIGLALDRPRATLAAAGVVIALGLAPLAWFGSEFLPDVDEGDLLYMPSAYTGLSVGKARELLQQTDRLIRTVPEVARVFGKAGRAETATDPAPLGMLETVVQLKPRREWRPGMTPERLRQELEERVRLPGLTNAWVMPIRARIDMLATGIRTPVGVKIAGPDLRTIEAIGRQVERVVGRLDGTRSVYAERAASARYLDIRIDRAAAAQHWLGVEELQDVIATAVGGMNVGETIEGRERYPINLRYAAAYRDSVERLRALPIVTERELQVELRDVAQVAVKAGPDMIRSENARLNGWVYIDIDGRDLGSYVAAARAAVAEQVRLPPGYALSWSGQYEYWQRAQERLAWIAPLTLALIVLVLSFVFRHAAESLMVLAALPLALVGGVWLTALLGYELSVATAVGFLALAGVATEFGVVMLVYLDQAVRRHRPTTASALRAAVIEGAVQRVRPKAMTVAVILAGLLPILLGSGSGSELMRRIAAPMVGGMITAPLVSMVLIPVLYLLWQGRRLPRPS